MSTIYSPDPHQVERVAWGQLSVGAARKFNANDQGMALMAQGMPKYYEAARQGKIFTKWIDDAATAKAPLAATPLIATAATWFLFNDNTTASGVCLIPIRGWYILASGTAAVGDSLAVQVPKGDQTRFTADGTGVYTSCLNGSNNVGSAYLDTGKTMVGAQSTWNIYSQHSDVAGATFGGASAGFDFDGLYIVPPQGGFAMEVLGGLGTSALYYVGVTYIETKVDIGA